MSRIQIILLLILILGIVYGVFRHPQTKKYMPAEARQFSDRLSIDKIRFDQAQFDQLGNYLKLDNLPENQFTTWLKSKFIQENDYLTDNPGDKDQLINTTLQSSQDSMVASEVENTSALDDATDEEAAGLNSTESVTADDETNGNEPIDAASDQIKTLTSRALEIGAQTKQILGASIQVAQDESGKPQPIYQSALKSGLYYYCRQVVEDYEKYNSQDQQDQLE